MSEMNARTSLLIGDEGLERLKNSHVTVIGLGGVGGHCVEALARAGVGKMHLIDADVVDISNINRQLIATKSTVGMKKTDAMEKRLNDVSDCVVTSKQGFVTADNVGDFLVDTDFLIDAIDTVSAKIAIAKYATERNIDIVSCMGAGNRLDPMAFHITDVYKTSNCGLARAMRHGLRKIGVEKLAVLCSKEIAMTNVIAQNGRHAPGSISFVPAAAGLALAAYVTKGLLKVNDK